MTDRTTEEAKREEGDLIAWAKLLALDLDTASGCTERDQLIINEARSGLRLLKQALEAALQWQAEQQKGEAASDAREVLAAGIVSHYGVPDDKAYECASKVLDLASSPHGVPPGYALVPVEPTDEMEAMAENAYEAASSPFPDWKAAYRAMLSSLPQAPQGEQWRPIETAPKDGTPIIVSWPMRELDEDDAPTGQITSRSTLVTWMSGGCWIEPDYLGASGSWYGDNDAFADAPDLWQPIPAPPPLAQGDSQ